MSVGSSALDKKDFERGQNYMMDLYRKSPWYIDYIEKFNTKQDSIGYVGFNWNHENIVVAFKGINNLLCRFSKVILFIDSSPIGPNFMQTLRVIIDQK